MPILGLGGSGGDGADREGGVGMLSPHLSPIASPVDGDRRRGGLARAQVEVASWVPDAHSGQPAALTALHESQSAKGREARQQYVEAGDDRRTKALLLLREVPASASPAGKGGGDGNSERDAAFTLLREAFGMYASVKCGYGRSASCQTCATLCFNVV